MKESVFNDALKKMNQLISGEEKRLFL